MAVKIQIEFFWVVMPCNVNTEDGDSMDIWNVGILP